MVFMRTNEILVAEINFPKIIILNRIKPKSNGKKTKQAKKGYR